MRQEKRLLAALLAENGASYVQAAVLGVVLLLNLAGIWKTVFGIDTAILVTAAAGYKTVLNCITALMNREISADVALCVAMVAAISVGEYLAAAEAMFIVMVGETLESFAAGRTEAAISRFVAQLPRTARLLVDGHELEVEAASLEAGNRIVARAGERIAADGVIEAGVSSIDESSITGEALPQDKQAGDEVFSGTRNGNGLLRIRVTRAGSETTLARVVQLVEEAKSKQAPVVRLADQYAKYFLPALLLAGALTYYFTGNWLRTVAVLVVACPCALILATPTAMVAAIGGLARRGILVRGGAVLQVAAKVDAIAFDKTGTVTEGRFAIVKMVALGRCQEDLLALAAAAEGSSQHALARVIAEEAARRRIEVPAVEQARVIPGCGAECRLGGRVIRAGNARFLEEQGIRDTQLLREEADHLGATAVLVADGEELAGAIFLRDQVRDGVREAVAALVAMGVGQPMILTGDRRAAAEALARAVGIERVEAEVLPEQKLERVRQLAQQGCTVAMVGDGINDAPALAAASLGVAVAGASDIAADAAGVIYLPHSLDRLPCLFETARRAMKTAWINIVVFAGAVNLLAVLACATGRLGPLGAAMTHQLSSFLVMMNSLRLLYVGPSLEDRIWRRWAGSEAERWWKRLREVEAAAVWAWIWERRRAAAQWGGVAAAGLVVLGGFYAVQPDEVGVIERFGKKVTPFSGPGLHYKLPWPVERLTRIRANWIRVVEIGYRGNASSGAAMREPASYEWNVQHRGGRFQARPEEALALTGDQNMIELNATVHYRVEHPDAFLFRQMDGDGAMREASESVIHGVVSGAPMDDVLTTHRREMERRALEELQQRADRYELGVRVLQVKLEDVHPSREVVDAFREVSAAFEEKNRMVNEAEAYRNEQVALARGNGRAGVVNAEAYRMGRANRAAGDASRFVEHEEAYRTAPGVTDTRLYLETMEAILPGRKKLIVDGSKGKQHLMLLEDGVEIAPPVVLGGKQ